MNESETDSRDASAEQITIVGAPREESEDLHASAAEAGWLGRYVPLKRVGRGAFGAVYAAYDPQLDRKIALKVLRAERQTPHNRIRLLREARALAAVSHPNVVSVFDVGERDDGGAIHIAMEFIEGQSLRKWWEQTQPASRKILATVIAIARGLAAAHAAGLAHRDIKPDNVMVTAEGTPKIVDFGLARAGRSDSEDGAVEAGPTPALDELTGTGFVVGTPAYMAPEQHEGQRGDAQSDQFSFCVLAYEAFVRARPFAGAGIDELRINVFAGRAVPPPRGSMPRWLWPVLQRGLSVDPGRRHASMNDLLDEIARRRRRPRRVLIGLAIAAALTPAIVGAAIGATPQCAAADDEIDPVWGSAERERIAKVFVEARPEHGAAMAERVTASADDFATRWKAGMTESCEATRVRETQSDELFDLRAVCYREGLTAFTESVRLWQEGDATVVDHALATASNLPAPEDCTHVLTLRKLQPRPQDVDALAEIAAIEEEVVRARVQWRSGHVPTEMKGLTERAVAVGYRPLEARVRLLAGDVTRTVSHTDITAYHDALAAAIAGGDTRAAIDAAIRQCTLYRVAHELQRADESCDLADALIESSPDEAFADKTLALAVLRAELLLGRGEVEQAREQLTNIRAEAQAQGADNAFFDATSALARVEQTRGRPESAVALIEEAKRFSAELYGPLHPNTLNTEADVGAMLSEAGRNEDAKERLTALIATVNETQGADSRNLWQNYINLALTQKELGDAKAGLANADKSRELLGDGKGDERGLCYVLATRGVIAHVAGEKARAEASLAEAEACLERYADRVSPDEAAVLYGQIAWVHEQEKRAEQAIAYYDRVEQHLMRVTDVDPAKLVVVHAAKASLLHDLGRLDAAQTEAREAFRIASTRTLGSHTFARRVQEHLVETLDKVGLRDEASSMRVLVPTEIP